MSLRSISGKLIKSTIKKLTTSWGNSQKISVSREQMSQESFLYRESSRKAVGSVRNVERKVEAELEFNTLLTGGSQVGARRPDGTPPWK